MLQRLQSDRAASAMSRVEAARAKYRRSWTVHDSADALVDTVRQYFGLDIEAIAGIEGAKAIVERCFPAGQNRVL